MLRLYLTTARAPDIRSKALQVPRKRHMKLETSPELCLPGYMTKVSLTVTNTRYVLVAVQPRGCLFMKCRLFLCWDFLMD